MCDVMVMSSRINKLSRSGFNNRLKLTTKDEIANIRGYNRRIEKLVDDVYDVFQEIGEQEWTVLQEPLDLLISTTKDLLKTYKKKYKNHEECENLEGMWSYLVELRNDIVRFRLPNPMRTEMEAILSRIGERMKQRNAS
ncbi:MAG: hypothetical protein LIP09_15360 [Bacteroidales bacterium]|nr:hypothetical protein [Bacteroidales bacterium]